MYKRQLNGNGAALIEFRVVDTGPAGNNVATVSNTLTFDITAVPDAPTGADQTITIDEDQPYEFEFMDFEFADGDNDMFDSVSIVSVSGGTLFDDSVPGSREVVGGDQIAANAVDQLRFVPEPNLNGNGAALIEFRVVDTGPAGNNVATVPNTLTFDISAVPDAPTGADQTITVDEDQPYGFEFMDFEFEDGDGDMFDSVSIVSVSGGTLFDDSVPGSREVVSGDLIAANAVDELRFVPEFNLNGIGAASIDFRVVDTGPAGNNVATVSNTLTFDITAVPDAPVGVSSEQLVEENGSFSFTEATFGFSDPIDRGFNNGTADAFAGVRIVSFSGNGTLTTDSGAVMPMQIISAAELSQLVYEPASGESGNGEAFIEFNVIDSGLTNNMDTVDRLLTINVAPELFGPQQNDGQPDDDESPDGSGDTNVDDSIDPTSPPEGAIPVTNSDSDARPVVGLRIPAPLNNNGANTINNDISFSDFDFSDRLDFTRYNAYGYESFIDTGLLTSDIVSRALASGRVGVQDFADGLAFAAVFWEEIDSASHNYIETTVGDIETVITVGGIGSLAFGFVFRWVLVGASMGATYAQPLWVTSFDLLPVIESDDESIEQIVDNQTE